MIYNYVNYSSGEPESAKLTYQLYNFTTGQPLADAVEVDWFTTTDQSPHLQEFVNGPGFYQIKLETFELIHGKRHLGKFKISSK